MSVTATFRTTRALMDEIDRLVKEGVYRSKTEAFNEGLRTIIRRYRADKAYQKILTVREDTGEYPPLARKIMEAHEEEDEL
jgi:Arc/MetJ-type ribon-helix-helix transcriptional regulator